MQEHHYPSFAFEVDLVIEWNEDASAAKQKHHRKRRREPASVLGGV